MFTQSVQINTCEQHHKLRPLKMTIKQLFKENCAFYCSGGIYCMTVATLVEKKEKKMETVLGGHLAHYRRYNLTQSRTKCKDLKG